MVTERTDCGDCCIGPTSHLLSPLRHRYSNYFGSVTNVDIKENVDYNGIRVEVATVRNKDGRRTSDSSNTVAMMNAMMMTMVRRLREVQQMGPIWFGNQNFYYKNVATVRMWIHLQMLRRRMLAIYTLPPNVTLATQEPSHNMDAAKLRGNHQT
jgi:hypothetical protein